MKKTLSVNLGGTVFNIDEDAYQVLMDYLQDVKHHLGDEKSSEEVLNDIEQRMGELFTEWMQGHREVVTTADVQRVISILGRPEQYDSTDTGTEGATGEEGTGNAGRGSGTDKRRRRLYRDTENAIIGGVCSGLAAYLNVSVVLLRLIYFVMVWFGGTGILLYLLCWIIIPEARTAAQRLEMQGEDVTIENIERKVRDEYGKVKDRVGNYVDSGEFENNAKSIGYKLGEFLRACIKILFGFIAGVIGLAGFLILAGLIVALIVLWTGNFDFVNMWTDDWYPFQQAFLDPSMATTMTIGIILVIGIPFIAIFNLLFGRTLNLKPTPRWMIWVGMIVWFIGIGLTIFSGMNWFNENGGFWIYNS